MTASTAEIGGGGGEKQRMKTKRLKEKKIKDKEDEEIPKKCVADCNLALWYHDRIWEKSKIVFIINLKRLDKVKINSVISLYRETQL